MNLSLLHVEPKLSAYADGELTPPAARRVAAHLARCARCRAALDEVRLGAALAARVETVRAPDALWGAIAGELAARRDSAARTGGEPATARARSAGGGGRTADEIARDAAARAPTTAQRPTLDWGARRLGFGAQTPWLAAGAIAALALVAWILPAWLGAPPWQSASTHPAPALPGGAPAPGGRQGFAVTSSAGAPRVDGEAVASDGLLPVGAWLETDDASSARVEIADIGSVDVSPNTRVRLVATSPGEHRLELERGRLAATIVAPPRVFVVETPSGTAIDLGCAYTIDVRPDGSSLLRVTSGQVALDFRGREARVLWGAVCETRVGFGPGTPYLADAPAPLRRALERFDFDGGGGDALGEAIALARPRDALSLWHLLARAEGPDRERVYDRLARLVPPPEGMTREGALALDAPMLDAWLDRIDWDRRP